MNVSTATNGDIESVFTMYDDGNWSLEVRKESDENDSNNTNQRE